MKKYFILLSIFSISTLVFSQTNINELERVNGLWTKKGETKPFTGEFIEYSENGDIKGKGVFRNGLVDGLRIMYFENGGKSMERYYKAGQNEGSSIEYYSNGQVKQETIFKGGKENGVLKAYYENGKIHAILNFVDGVQQGDYYEYSIEGKLIAQYYFRDGEAGYSPEFMKITDNALKLSRKFKNDEAIKLYNQAVLLNPTVAQIYFNRGTCKSNDFDFNGAIEDYNIAIQLKPDYMEAYTNRGNAKINLYTSKGKIHPTSEQTKSACEDFYKAKSLGDNGEVDDFIYLYCEKKQ